MGKSSYLQFNADGTGLDYMLGPDDQPITPRRFTYSLSATKLSLKYETNVTDVFVVLDISQTNLGIKYVTINNYTTNYTTRLDQYYYYTK